MNKIKNLSRLQIPIYLGTDPDGNSVYKDIIRLPSLFISGRAGTGRLMLLHNIMKTLTIKYTSDELKFLIINPGGLDFQSYKDSPYLYMPIIDNAESGLDALKQLTLEANKRHSITTDALGHPAEFLSREPRISEYNEKHKQKMPHIVVIVEESADLILANRALFNKTLRKLCGLWAQIHGIYTIVATQRIDKHGFTNAMKQFMPTVVSFQTPTQKDSINILRMPGAEDLADFGEILYSEAGRIPSRIQTPYLDYNNLDKEV